jgi:hypothetical protein
MDISCCTTDGDDYGFHNEPAQAAGKAGPLVKTDQRAGYIHAWIDIAHGTRNAVMTIYIKIGAPRLLAIDNNSIFALLNRGRFI